MLSSIIFIYMYIYFYVYAVDKNLGNSFLLCASFRITDKKASKTSGQCCIYKCYIQVSALRITLLLCDLTFSADWTVFLLSIFNSPPSSLLHVAESLPWNLLIRFFSLLMSSALVGLLLKPQYKIQLQEIKHKNVKTRVMA